MCVCVCVFLCKLTVLSTSSPKETSISFFCVAHEDRSEYSCPGRIVEDFPKVKGGWHCILGCCSSGGSTVCRPRSSKQMWTNETDVFTGEHQEGCPIIKYSVKVLSCLVLFFGQITLPLWFLTCYWATGTKTYWLIKPSYREIINYSWKWSNQSFHAIVYSEWMGRCKLPSRESGVHARWPCHVWWPHHT